MSGDGMCLYWGSGSINSWKPQIVFEEKGMHDYPNKQLSLSDKEHKSPQVMKINPRGQVPTFKDGDLAVNDSAAICFYLEKKYENTGTRLLPANNTEYGSVVQRTFETYNLYAASITNIVLYKQFPPKGGVDQEVLEARFESLRTELGRWDGFIAAAGGFVAGATFSMADVFFIPLLAFCVRLGLDLAKYPAIKAYYEKVKDRPSIKASWPPHWRDGPGTNTAFAAV